MSRVIRHTDKSPSRLIDVIYFIMSLTQESGNIRVLSYSAYNLIIRGSAKLLSVRVLFGHVCLLSQACCFG